MEKLIIIKHKQIEKKNYTPSIHDRANFYLPTRQLHGPPAENGLYNSVKQEMLEQDEEMDRENELSPMDPLLLSNKPPDVEGATFRFRQMQSTRDTFAKFIRSS